MAAARTAEQLRKAEYAGPITLISDEVHLPYDRPPLSKDVLRAEVDDTTLKPAEFYDENNITLLLGSGAAELDTEAQTVTLTNGEVVAYEELVIATGLVPRTIPTLPNLAGIRVLRTYDESMALREHAGSLASVLGTEIGELVARLHRAEGVDVRCGVGVTGVTGTGHVEKVQLADGSELDADVVVVGIGSRPSTDWLEGSGIAVDNGVVCDIAGRTSAPNVWAIGDVASWRDAAGHQVRVEHWSNVAEQARVIVPAMLGRDATAAVVVPYFWSDQYDVKIQCLGEPKAGDTVHIIEDDGRKFLAFYERDGAVSGVVGGGMPGKVMKNRAKVAAAVPIADVLG
nr:FAD-dependent oxidoreductase [Mycolicibacterium sp. CBMA 361]